VDQPGVAGEHSLAAWVVYRLRGPLAVGLTLVVVSTAGYMTIEAQYGFVDALYMTAITLGTIGFGEVHPLDTAGRILTIAIIVAGFGTLVYTGSVLTTMFASGEVSDQIRRRRSHKMRESLQDHVIVAGYGRVGHAVARSVQAMGRPCAVIDPNEQHEHAISSTGAIPVLGDATDEDDLRRAGIERAIGLVAATDRDATNLVIVLTARSIRPDLRIVSRVNEARWSSRIENAGADVAHSPYESYGASLAASVVTPAVVDLHDLPLLGLSTEEIVVDRSSSLIGAQIAELADRHVGVYVLGLRREQQLQKWHEVSDPIREGDIVLVLGTPENLAALTR
jgi:voltage-gated potassium channel